MAKDNIGGSMATVILEQEREIVETVRINLKKLMKEHGLTVNNFCNFIKNEGEAALDRTTFKKFMAGGVHKPNIGFLVSCSRVFGVSLDNLASSDFNLYENFKGIRDRYGSISQRDHEEALFGYTNVLSREIFIENPDSFLLQKYLQRYYCYYYSTVATENNKNDIRESLISGELELKRQGGKCKATLQIDTKMLNKDGTKKYKIYSGDVIFCPSIQSVHCILALPEGEFCFIIFRYSHLNVNMQECRLAEVLSTSSTPDKRYPVVHRMLLSKEEIREEDWEAIAPCLCMNSREILISENGLSKLATLSESYEKVIQEILQRDSEQIYCISENTIEEISSQYLEDADLSTFIADLRAHSTVKRYNKVSAKADERVRDILLKRGYFREKV